MTKNILKKIVITTSRKSSSFIFGLEMLTKSRNNDHYQKSVTMNAYQEIYNTTKAYQPESQSAVSQLLAEEDNDIPLKNC